NKAAAFFFQAEDGIRNATVTGVQTCALPIYRRLVPVTSTPVCEETLEKASSRVPTIASSRTRTTLTGGARLVRRERPRPAEITRSEERRVGKGGGCAEGQVQRTMQRRRDSRR